LRYILLFFRSHAYRRVEVRAAEGLWSYELQSGATSR